MEKYHSYIPSGIEWIGDIPETWKVKRIGQLFLQRNETVSDTEYQPLSVSKNGIVPQMEGVAKTDNNDNRRLVKKGDFVINSRSDRKGSSGYSNLDGSVSVINIVLKPINIYPKYSHYLFRSYLFIEEFFRNGKGIVMDLWSTRYSEMKYMTIPYPPINEQHQIVEFLDSKTELTDRLISTKERKITLLKEQRTSLINQVVTKGLNPNVKMKDSGVEWIGKIPEHYSVITLHKLLQTNKLEFQDGNHGGEHPNPEEFEDVGVPFIKPKDIQDGKVEWDTCDKLPIDRCQRFRIGFSFNNDVLLVNRGGSIGKVCFVNDFKEDFPYFVINPQVTYLRGKNGLDSKFVFYITKSDIFRCGVDLILGHGSTFPFLGLSNMGDFQMVLPPIQEQQQIVDYLDTRTKEIDDLVSIEQKKIDLLKEYRQSLISEVITGKIKVTTD